jgi:DNA-binding NtrC family response regulator
VDDDADLASTLCEFLEQEGYSVDVAHGAEEAVQCHRENPGLALALVDLMMPMTDGLTLMERLHDRQGDLPILIMTGYGTIETAVEAIKRGAEDYLTKPFDREAVRKKVGRVMELHRLRQKVEKLEDNLREVNKPFEKLVYVSPQMQKVVERASAVALSDVSVMIVGETGTGKEMLARAIHGASRRAGAPFVAVNCGALPRDLVESEMFGVKRGAFTGAVADSPGVFVTAEGGTLFLDELGEMPKECQVKLLRVLQEHELRPLGGTRNIKVNVRVISATNRSLQEVRTSSLREDLYYRVATVVIDVPPLRSRPEDILVLAQHFAAKLAETYGRHITVASSAVELLLRYGFPGNVRELLSLLESATAVRVDDPQSITDKDLLPLIHASGPADARLMGSRVQTMEEMERLAIERALRRCDGNRTRAAALLGISRDTLYRKAKDLQIKM